MKSYTDLEQSRKLVGFLPIESADMEYMFLKEDGSKASNIPFVKDDEEPEWPSDSAYDFIPCWSLAALLGVLPVMIDYKGSLIRLRMDKGNVGQDDYAIWYDDLDNGLSTNIAYEAKNYIDACYEMIIKLHELNLI